MRDKIYRSGSSGCKNYLRSILSVNIISNIFTGVFIGLSSVRSQFMYSPVDICICTLRQFLLQLNNGIRALRSCSIVQIHQRLAIDFLVQGRELVSDVFERHNDIVKSYKFT